MNLPFNPALADATVAFKPGIRLRRAASPRTGAAPSLLVAPPRPVVRDRRCLRYRLNVGCRVFAGSFGAYGVVATLGMLLARALPIARAEAVMTATLVALLLFPAVTIGAFLTRSPQRALGGVVTLTMLFGTLAAMLPPPA